MDRQILAKLNELRRGRQAVILVTDLSGRPDRLIVEGDALDGALADAAASAFRSGKSTAVELEGQSLFLNVHLPPPRIVVIGAVHISQVLARMAALAGFDVTIIDPRTAFATPERFAGVRVLAQWPEDALAAAPLDRYSAICLLTHDSKIDDRALVHALRADCFYIGALGSRKTHAKRLERMRAEGFDEAALARIHAPIGLDIGAVSPAEIAVSIMGEIIAAQRKKALRAERAAM